jgi:hypothetical protein
VGVAVAQKLVFQVESDYLSPLLQILSLKALLASPLYYLKCFSVLWENGYSGATQAALYVAVGGLALYGIWTKIKSGVERATSPSRPPAISQAEFGSTQSGSDGTNLSMPSAAARQVAAQDGQVARATPSKTMLTRILNGMAAFSVLDIFAVLYFLLIIAFPWGGRRYLMPIMPVYVFYALVGLRAICASRSSGVGLALNVSFGLAIGLCFLAKYTTVNWREIPGGTQGKPVVEMTEYVRREIGKMGLVVFEKPRFLALYGETRGTDCYLTDNDEKALDHYRRIGVSHVIVSRVFHDQEEACLTRFVQQKKDLVENAFENADFTVYRLK